MSNPEVVSTSIMEDGITVSITAGPKPLTKRITIDVNPLELVQALIAKGALEPVKVEDLQKPPRKPRGPNKKKGGAQLSLLPLEKKD